MFTSSECILTSFKKKIQLPNKYFGIFKRELFLSKERCLMSLKYKYSFWFSQWEIDLCRDPIHVRYENFFGPELIRKDGECDKGQKNSFCQTLSNLHDLIDNELLIYSEGERDQISSGHGTAYCLDLLFKSYLVRNFSFSMEQSNNYNIFKNEKIDPASPVHWPPSADQDPKVQF